MVPIYCLTDLALELKLGLAISSHGTPGSLISCLAVVTNRLWLPWLIESLEIESVEAPVEERAEAILPEGLGILSSAVGLTVVGAN